MKVSISFVFDNVRLYIQRSLNYVGIVRRMGLIISIPTSLRDVIVYVSKSVYSRCKIILSDRVIHKFWSIKHSNTKLHCQSNVNKISN